MIIELSDENYSDLVGSASKAIFIDFYSPMCGPCQEVFPLLMNLDNYFKDEAIIAKVDVICLTLDEEYRKMANSSYKVLV